MVEAARKQLELLRKLVPGLARLSLVLRSNRKAFAEEITHGAVVAAREAGLATRLALVETGADVARELARLPGHGAHAALVFGFTASIDPQVIAGSLLRLRVPAVFEQRRYVEAGGLVSYQLDWDDQVQRIASKLDKVLRGEDPATLPFEFPTRSELVINTRTAKTLGLVIPLALRVRADAVIE